VDPPWKVSAKGALASFGAGIAVIVLRSLLRTPFESALVSRSLDLICMALATYCFGRGAVLAFVTLSRIAISPEPVSTSWSIPILILPGISGGLFAFFGMLMTIMISGNARGRQLRSRGKVLLPPVENGHAWAHLPMQVDLTPESRDAFAAQWRENGRTEHASVAAFAKLTLDLMAHRDSLDEIRHAELCFSVARAVDGRDESPGPFPRARAARTLPGPRSLALAKLAVDSLVDGALHEGLSARVLAKLTRRCEVPDIRALVRELAADEGRHSKHGWDVVEWCLGEGGRPVAFALRGACASLRNDLASELPAEARSGAWERFGIPGAVLEAEEHARARQDILRRVKAMTESHCVLFREASAA
jgi:hypothetical protein